MLPATILRFPDHSLFKVAILLVIVLLCRPSAGQSTPSSSQDGTQSSDASASTKSSDQKKRILRRGEFVVAPIPISSPALGTGIIPVLAYIFRLDREDEVSPPSVLGAAGLITNNGSRVFAVAGQLYLKRDTYHASAAFLQGNLN